MKKSTGATLPIWTSHLDLPLTSQLRENITCDVCIVGAGIAGLTTAYLLSKEGKRVVVLESKSVAGGETSRTTAHLSNALDEQYYNLIKLFGVNGARLACQSHASAIDKIQEISRDEGIDSEFERVDGYLFANNQEQGDKLLQELEAVQQVGWTDVVLRKKCPLPSLTNFPCLHYPNQGRVHIMKYMIGLMKAIQENGGQIFTNSHVVEFKEGIVTTAVTTDNFSVTANHLVVTTNTPVNDKFAIHTKQFPYRTYVIGVRVPKDEVPDALYWDMDTPYHYVRLQKGTDAGEDFDVLIVGGEDHKTGQHGNPAECFLELERWTRQKFPMAQEVIYNWSGQVYEPVDGLAYIGRNPGSTDNVYIATGDSGHGITHGTIAGMIITDLIMERQNPWAKLYDPDRVSLNAQAVSEYVKENMNVAAQMSDHVTAGEVEDVMQVMPGTGSIMRKGASKVAVYCDQDGVRHQCSAICPHLGCVVHWNNVESSWDCPCHGSRFDPFGKVVMGPSNSDLGPAL